MKIYVPIMMGILVFLIGCSPKSELTKVKKDLESAQAELKETHKLIGALNSTNRSATLKIVELESAISSAKNETQSALKKVEDLEKSVSDCQTRMALAEAELAEKPEMPVKVSFRKARLGNGNVAVFDTTIKNNFPVLVTISSKALGTQKQHRLDLSWNAVSEVGHAEGSPILEGDSILIQNSAYKDLVVRFE